MLLLSQCCLPLHQGSTTCKLTSNERKVSSANVPKPKALTKVYLSMSSDKKDCLREVQDLVANLSSWKEELHQHITSVINSQGSAINAGIGNLVEEVCGLKDEVSLLKKERIVFKETVDLLNVEIRKLNAKLHPLPEPEKVLDNNKVVGAGNNKEEISTAIQQDQEKEMPSIIHRTHSYSETDESYDLNLIGSAIDTIQEEEQDTEDNVEREDRNKDKPNKTIIINFKRQRTTHSLDGSICPECKFEFSTDENLRVHIENIHPKSEMLVNSKIEGELHEESENQIKKSPSAHISVELKNKSNNYNKGETKKCKVCPYETTYGKILTRHVKAVHLKIRNHICDDCGYATSHKFHLKSHKERVHKMGKKKIEKKKFLCELCPYKTYWKHHLSKHVEAIHH